MSAEIIAFPAHQPDYRYRTGAHRTEWQCFESGTSGVTFTAYRRPWHSDWFDLEDGFETLEEAAEFARKWAEREADHVYEGSRA